MAAKTNLTQEQIENIQNYGDEIETLKNFVEAVRKRPGMYIGHLGDEGYINMAREIFQNAYDELIKLSSPCDTIIVSFDERTFTFIVEDNGRGIPFGHMIRIFNNQHTSSNYTRKKGEYPSGLHGVGAKVTNALSEFFKVESYNSITGEGRIVEFKCGYPWDKGEKSIPNPDNKQGTIVTFIPDLKILGPLNVNKNSIRNLIEMLLPLSDKGSKCIFNTIDIHGKQTSEVIVNEDGIFKFMVELTQHPLVMPIHLFKDTGFMKMDIQFTYDTDITAMNEETVMAFANSCPTIAGPHIDGLKEGIAYFFTNYMNKVYLTTTSGKKNKNLKITAADTRVGLKAVLSAAHIEPTFSGQAKEILDNKDMGPFIKNSIVDGLEEWSKNNPKDFAKVCRYLKDVAELRLKQDKEKINLNKKYASNTLTGLPSKYVQPVGKKNLELWIVEGDSAAGNMDTKRNIETQGYFPIRGKMPNAFATSAKEFLENAEVAGIINIIGGGYGKNFDISKVKWEKIVFGADADADGSHICSLLFRFFVLYMPQLIIEGRVFKSVPPLYGLPNKNGKTIYFTEKIDYIKYIQKLFAKNNVISYANGKTVSQMDLTKILYINNDYTYELCRIAGRYAVDPELLETLLFLHLSGADYKKLKSGIEKKYRFIKVDKINEVIHIEGSLNSKIQTLFFNEKMIQDCEFIINILNKNKDVTFQINGNLVNLYELMVKFEESSPNNISRFKGLGEMDPPELYESTLEKENRTLIQYTLEDVKYVTSEIRYYEDNKEKLLEGIEVSRFDVIG